MATSVFYVQPCPTCGRKQQVRVAYLGKAITCQHCQTDFVAQQPTESGDNAAASESGLALLDRAEHLLLRLARERDAAQREREKVTA